MAGLSVLNVMDRQLLAVLIDPIKRELGVSDAAMGLLTGTSFAVLHVVATIPIAVWADRSVRRSIIAWGLAIWSALTVLTGFARSFGEIFAIRIGVGIGEATGSGPAQSLLSDYFPPERRATAIAVLVMGGPLGSMISFAAGGWLADLYGWRMAFVAFGAPGLLLALLIRFTLSEPPRGALDAIEAPVRAADHGKGVAVAPAADRRTPDDPAPVPFRVGLASLVAIPAVRCFVLASALNTVGIYAILVWAVPYMTRVHALTTGEAGVRLAVASGLFTALGTLVCGPVADRLARRDVRWLAWLPASTSALVFPFGLGFAFAPSGDLASALLAPASLLAGCYFGPVYGAVQTLAAPRTRALAAALITAMNTVLGLGVAPPLVGWLNDLGTPSFGAAAIRHSLGLVLVAHLLAAGLLLRAAATLGPGASDRGAPA
ncbi:MAG: MFS transporter [Myxococcota bacterium]